MYADDTTLILADLDSVKLALDSIQIFSTFSGLKLNLDKCEGIGLGQYKGYIGEYANIKFSDEPVKCIGLYIGHNKIKCYELNWDSKIRKMEREINHWKMRKLTLFGKILVLKSLAISKLIYNFSLLDIKDDTVKKLNKKIYDFVWHKRDRIKRNTIIGDIVEGGLSMIDIQAKIDSLRASWIPRLLYDNHPWKHVLFDY